MLKVALRELQGSALFKNSFSVCMEKEKEKEKKKQKEKEKEKTKRKRKKKKGQNPTWSVSKWPPAATRRNNRRQRSFFSFFLFPCNHPLTFNTM